MEGSPLARLGRALGRSLVGLIAVLSLGQGLWLSLPAADSHRDLLSFQVSGRFLLAGENPYQITAYPVNLNPPFATLLFTAFSAVPRDLLIWSWHGLGLLLFALALATLARLGPRPCPWTRLAWAVSLSAPWYTLAHGNLYFVLLWLVLAAWLLLRADRPGWAGLPIALLAAIKPSFLIWPLLLWLIGARRTAATALGGGLVCSLLPLVVGGPTVYGQWLTLARGVPEEMMAGNASLQALIGRLTSVPLSLAATGLFCLAIMAWLWHRRATALEASGIALLLGLLASPVTWSGYMLLLLPALFQRSSWSPAIIVGLLGLSFPMVQLADELLGNSRYWPGGAVMTIALLLILADLLRRAGTVNDDRHQPQPVAPLASGAPSHRLAPVPGDGRERG